MLHPNRQVGGYPGLGLALLMSLCLGMPVARLGGGEVSRVPFAIAAADALVSLEKFSEQSGAQIVYLLEEVRGVTTNPVQGEFAIREALDRLVAGTALKVEQDEKTGAYAIRLDRQMRAAAQKPGTTITPTSQNMKKPLVSRFAAVLAAFGSAILTAQTTPAANPDPAKEDVIELSPFVVNASGDVGYVATNSLAGTRLNSPLRDTGATINVLTAEFLADIAATSVEEAIAYAGNVTVDREYQGLINDNWALLGVAPSFRVRGLPATVTRNYFPWRVQTDIYNVDRIEEQRGPNSILFGIGSSGGVINTSTKQALLGRKLRRFSVMTDNYGSYRGTVDINQAYGDRLAIRLNGVYSRLDTFQQFTYNQNQRLHLAGTYKLRPKTLLRADFETARTERVSARPKPTADTLSNWIKAGKPLVAAPVTASAQLTALGLARLNANTARIVYLPQLGRLVDTKGDNITTGTAWPLLDPGWIDAEDDPRFTIPAIRELGDQLLLLAHPSVNLSGPGSIHRGDIDNATIMLEHQFGRNTFLQLAANLQLQDTVSDAGGQGRQRNLEADPNQFFRGGAANPFAGQYYVEGERWNHNISNTESKNIRLTLSHELDLGKWGNYRFAGLAENEWRSDYRWAGIEVWDGAPFNAAPENIANYVWRRSYVTPGDWGTYASVGPGVAGLLQDVPDPTTPGRTLSSHYVPFRDVSLGDTPEEQFSFLAALQARYFSGRLVAAFGYRQDKLEFNTKQAVRDPITNEWSITAPGHRYIEDSFRGNTRTLGLVGHATKNLSLFYNFSNTIGLPDTTKRIAPAGLPPPTPTGEGHDYGFSLNLLDGKLVIRANGYKTDLKGGTTSTYFSGTADSPVTLSNRVFDAAVGAGRITQAEADAHDIIVNGVTFDQKVEGYELSVVGNPTKTWRVSLSYSYTDGFDSSIASEIRNWAVDGVPYLRQFADLPSNVAGPTTGTFLTVGQLIDVWEDRAAEVWRNEGNLISGLRQHKVSFFTRYTFDTGRLAGLSVGAGHRYQSKLSLGTWPDLSSKWGNSLWFSELSLGYRIKRLLFLKHGLNLQLNVKNLFDRKVPLGSRLEIDPRSGLEAYQNYNIVEPRTWRLTADFEF